MTTTTRASDSTTGTTGGTGELSDLGHGVSADTIKLGIAIVDYDAIADFVDFTRGDQQATAQVFVDYINENGGVGGRKIEPVYKKYPPIPGRSPTRSRSAPRGPRTTRCSRCSACSSTSPATASCASHATTTRSTSVTSSSSRGSTRRRGGLMLTPDTTKESAAQYLINLLAEEGKLEGKTVAVLADQDAEGRVNDVIVPGLEEAGSRRARPRC